MPFALHYESGTCGLYKYAVVFKCILVICNDSCMDSVVPLYNDTSDLCQLYHTTTSIQYVEVI